jgi:hypothetical protein
MLATAVNETKSRYIVILHVDLFAQTIAPIALQWPPGNLKGNFTRCSAMLLCTAGYH